MRNRYFSPDHPSSFFIQKHPQSNKLRWVGSMKKLTTLEKPSESENIRIIGQHTYKFQKQIGSGYSSKVYKAIKIQLVQPLHVLESQQNKNKQVNQQCYAIKVIQLKKYSASNMQMLQNEIRILKNLDHPKIIKCFDISKSSNHCYIVTQFCQNGDLLQHLTRKGSFSEQEASIIMKDIVQGYKYLISKGILHRDLKPANILRSKDCWKIADFGFSIEAEWDFKSKENVGTPLYMPIQSLTKNVYSVKSDIFAIGIIYYELLVGCTPWECKSEKELIKKLSNCPFKFPERVRNGINQNVKQIIKKSCAIQYSERMNRDQFMKLSVQSMLNPEQGSEFQIKKCYSAQQNNYLIKNTGIIRKTSQDFSKNSQKGINNGYNKYGKDQSKQNAIVRLKRTQMIQREQIQQSTNLLKMKSVNSKLSTSEDQKRVQDKSFSGNHHVLVSQLYFCRFMYYVIKNASMFTISQASRDKLCLVLFKHIIKNIKLLSDGSRNWFNLENWDSFKSSKKYKNTRQTMKQYLIRYQREYLSFLKRMEINTIREVNRQLSGFSSVYHLTSAFYHQLSEFISPIIRQYNHNLSQVLHDSLYLLTDDLKGSIHGLHSLNKYCQLIKLYYKQGQLDFLGFEKNSEIKVHINYQCAPYHCMLEDYVVLRKQLKGV